MGDLTAPDTTGTLRHTASGWLAQFSVGPKQRKAVILRTCPDEASATRRKVAIAKLVHDLRDAGHLAMVPNVVRDSGVADDEGFNKIVRLVARVVAGKEPGLARVQSVRREGMTVEELAKLWTDGDLAEQFPDHVKVKREKQSMNDARIFRWFSKIRMPDASRFGARPVADVTLDDCDHVMAALPKEARTPSARRTYGQALRRLLVLAVYPVRLLEAVPIPKGWLPSGKSDRAKAWVYPSEDAALMACREVPLARRLFYGVLIREGLRVSEALDLTWPDLDLKRGVVRLDENKTDDRRSWVMGEDVTRALAAWRDLRGEKGKKGVVFPKELLGDAGDLAHYLREGLSLGGVHRPELTVPKAGRMLLRAHDLRGSFVTIALATGRTEAWVTDRTGHRSSQMIYLYKRASRTAAELGFGWFAPLDEAIPELAPKPRNGANTGANGGPKSRDASGGGSRNPGKQGVWRHVGLRDRRFVKRRSSVQIRKWALNDSEALGAKSDVESRKEGAQFAPSFAPPSHEVVIVAAIDRLTRALASADDDTIGDLVAERRALREELAALRFGKGGKVVRLDTTRREGGA